MKIDEPNEDQILVQIMSELFRKMNELHILKYGFHVDFDRDAKRH